MITATRAGPALVPSRCAAPRCGCIRKIIRRFLTLLFFGRRGSDVRGSPRVRGAGRRAGRRGGRGGRAGLPLPDPPIYTVGLEAYSRLTAPTSVLSWRLLSSRSSSLHLNSCCGSSVCSHAPRIPTAWSVRCVTAIWASHPKQGVSRGLLYYSTGARGALARVARAWSLSERRYVSISWPPPGGEAPRAAALLSATRSDERRRTRAGRRRFGDARHASGAGRAWGCSCAERRGGD